jgi:catechol 2,3-dioxygenase-like lactoylglutathione lyase family enzyme
MTSRIAVVTINVIDADVVAHFWCAALGWKRSDAQDEDVVSIEPVDGSWPTIDLVTVPDRKNGINRLHFDLRADGVTFEHELDRLLKLGAVRVDVGQPDDATWVVLADPEGNEFCLLRRTVEEVSAGREA